MWKGELFGTIDLDSLKGIAGLYGVGPIEGLAGELLIADGECFQSRVVSDSEMKVTASFDAKAPFFVYCVVNEWKICQIFKLLFCSWLNVFCPNLNWMFFC